ncbi:MAG: hypothetical protein F6K62_10765 [Sphaerospermopsis sp. SIO1G2]|nr:hypothetical protein [Sphaerospermopsis sp. SIO1G2]
MSKKIGTWFIRAIVSMLTVCFLNLPAAYGEQTLPETLYRLPEGCPEQWQTCPQADLYMVLDFPILNGDGTTINEEAYSPHKNTLTVTTKTGEELFRTVVTTSKYGYFSQGMQYASEIEVVQGATMLPVLLINGNGVIGFHSVRPYSKNPNYVLQPGNGSAGCIRIPHQFWEKLEGWYRSYQQTSGRSPKILVIFTHSKK